MSIPNTHIPLAKIQAIPWNYTALSYIESTGQQVIYPDILLTGQEDIETVFAVSSETNAKGGTFLYSNTRTTLYDRLELGYVGGWGSGMKVFYGVSSSNIIVPQEFGFNINDIINVQYSPRIGRLVLNGREYISAVSNSRPPDPISMFAHQEVGWSYLKLYSFRVKLQENTIFDTIPALDGEGRPCLYDLVSGKTLYNQGTREFIAGYLSP